MHHLQRTSKNKAGAAHTPCAAVSAEAWRGCAGRPQSAGMDEANAAAADASIENVRQVYQAWLIVQLSGEPSSAFDYPQPVMGIAEGVRPQ